jgi:hypothetical protein
MLCFLLFSSLVLSNCFQILNIATSYQNNDVSSCFDIRHSFFRDLFADEGGAVSVSGSVSFGIYDSMFFHCTALRFGGAIRSNCLNSSVADCCGIECFTTTNDTSDGYGQFVEFGEDEWSTLEFLVSFVSLLVCPVFLNPNIQRGTLHSENRCSTANVSNTNFTSGKAAEGSVVMITNVDSHLFCDFLTIVDLSGKSGIHFGAMSSQSIEFCNLYNNSMTPDNNSGVLFTSGAGMDISFCIFSNNSRDISWSGSEPWTVITISNCVFTAENWASSVWYLSLTNNIFSRSTASLDFAQLDAASCPRSTPQSLPRSSIRSQSSFHSPTPVSSPAPSRSLSPVRTASRSVVFTASFISPR